MRSALYKGRVEHVRRTPRGHAFGYALQLLFLDLDELEDVFAGRWLWSVERPNIASFRRRDYLGDPERPLDQAVREQASRELGRELRGPVRVLTSLRTLGYVFNPVSFYYCFSAGNPDELEAVVAEITNTPWGERHSYVVDARAAGASSGASETAAGKGLGADFEATFPKAFHISPFFGMQQVYRWRFSAPGSDLRVHMQNIEGPSTVFEARLAMQRRELSAGQLRGVLLHAPIGSWLVHAAIYWQALRLWLKRVPFYSHPAKRKPPVAMPK